LASSAKVAWVTGSSTGIGRAIALKLAEQGCEVAVHYNHSKEKAEEVAGRVQASRRRALLVCGDVPSAGDVSRMVRETDAHYGRLDVLVNNAGSIVETADLERMTEALWDRTVDVSLKSVYLCSRAAGTRSKPRSQSLRSSSSKPSAYFQSILLSTASAAWRSESPSANCITVTSASRHGAKAGCPRLGKRPVKSSSTQIVPSASLILV
jgi:NAD(P)-dependent dehydrogenase (short-subunit alcohol dehydrogenase family)